MDKHWLRALGVIGLLVLIYFSLFLHLDSLPIAIWDESLFALRALYLFQEGGYLYNFDFYSGLPSHQNTKLPFTTFFQVLGYHILGVNELAIRLPIAAIFLFSQVYIIYFLNKYFKNIWFGILMLLILIASQGIMQPHMLRTGDQDVPFAMYLVLCVLFFFNYVHLGKSRFLWGFVVAFLAALLTKNLLAGIIAPGLLMYLFLDGKAREFFKKKEIYFAGLTIVGTYLATLWYFEIQQTGFIQRMWEYELLGRYSTTIEGHSGSPLYYLIKLIKGMGGFVYPAFFSILILWENKAPKSLKSLVLLLWCAFASYFFIVSLSETKTMWYSAPLYPFAALLSGIALWYIYKQYIVRKPRIWKLVCAVVVLFIYAFTYFNTVKSNYLPKPKHKDEKYGLFLKKLERVDSKYTDFTIVDNNFGTSAYFYKEMYNSKDPKYNLKYQRTIELEPGMRVMSCLNNVLQPLKKQYRVRILEEYAECQLLEVIYLKDKGAF